MEERIPNNNETILCPRSSLLQTKKEGVAKTTSTINLAHAFIVRGKKVLMVDADPQASLTIYAGADPRALEKEEKTLYWGLMKDKPLEEIIISCQSDRQSAHDHYRALEPECFTGRDKSRMSDVRHCV